MHDPRRRDPFKMPTNVTHAGGHWSAGLLPVSQRMPFPHAVVQIHMQVNDWPVDTASARVREMRW